MKRIPAVIRFIGDAFDRREAASRPGDAEPKSLSDQIHNIDVATKTLPGAKSYLIRLVVTIIVLISVLVPLVILLNAKGIFFMHPSQAQPKAVEKSPAAAMVAGTSAIPHPHAEVSKDVQHTTAAGAAAEPAAAAPQPTVTSALGTPAVPALVGGLLKGTADTVANATSTLSQLLTAEADDAVATWCSLATALDSGSCDAAIGAELSPLQARPGAATASPAIVAVDQPSGNAARYTYEVRFGTGTVQVTMVWDGRNWHLSEPDYEEALRGGGILAPLEDLTSVVLGLT